MPAQKWHFHAGKFRNLRLGFHHKGERDLSLQHEDEKPTRVKIRMIPCNWSSKFNWRTLHHQMVHPIIALHHERVVEVKMGESVAKEESAPKAMAYTYAYIANMRSRLAPSHQNGDLDGQHWKRLDPEWFWRCILCIGAGLKRVWLDHGAGWFLISSDVSAWRVQVYVNWSLRESGGRVVQCRGRVEVGRGGTKCRGKSAEEKQSRTWEYPMKSV